MTEDDDNDLLMEDFVLVDEEPSPSPAESVSSSDSKPEEIAPVQEPEEIATETKDNHETTAEVQIPQETLIEETEQVKQEPSENTQIPSFSSDLSTEEENDTYPMHLAQSILEDFCEIDDDEFDTESANETPIQNTESDIENTLVENNPVNDTPANDTPTNESIEISSRVETPKSPVVPYSHPLVEVGVPYSHPLVEVGVPATPENVVSVVQTDVEAKIPPLDLASLPIPVEEVKPVERIRDRKVEWEYFIAERILPLVKRYKVANKTFVKDVNKQHNLIHCIQSLPENATVIQCGLELGYTLSLFLLHHDTIRVEVVDERCHPFTSELQQGFKQVFGDRVCFHGQSFEHVSFDKIKAHLILFNQHRTEAKLFSEMQKAWRHSQSRCIWIVNFTDHPEHLKATMNMLSRKDFLSDFTFPLEPAHQWIGQTEK